MTTARDGMRVDGASWSTVGTVDRRRWVVAAVVALATLPYLALKGVWLAGVPVGLTDPGFLAAPGIVAANVVTAALDLVAVALALVLARGTGRLPAWMIVVPGWVGVGFLVPIAVATVPALVLDALAGTAATGPERFAGWVQPLVYLAFTVQGLGLTVLLGWEARRRWSAALSPADPVAWVRTLATLAAAPAAVLAALHLARVAGSTVGLAEGATWTPGAAVVDLVRGLLIVAGVLGARAVAGGDRRAVVLAGAAVGTASTFAWGLYTATTTLGATAFATTDPVAGLAALTGCLVGLALGIGALACVAEPERARPSPSGVDR